MECENCSRECVLKSSPVDGELFGCPCDGCGQVYCGMCSGVSASEVRCLPSKKRIISYFCVSCKGEIGDVTGRAGELRRIESEMREAMERMKKLDEEVNGLMNEANIMKMHGEPKILDRAGEDGGVSEGESVAINHLVERPDSMRDIGKTDCMKRSSMDGSGEDQMHQYINELREHHDMLRKETSIGLNMIRGEIDTVKSDVRVIRESNIDLIKLLCRDTNRGAKLDASFRNSKPAYSLDCRDLSNIGNITNVDECKDDECHIPCNVGIGVNSAKIDQDIQTFGECTYQGCDTYTKNNYQESILNNDAKQNIYFFSDQQGEGIIAELVNYYSNTNVVSNIKPGSTLRDMYNEILQVKAKFMEDDIIVLQVGANDDDPNIANFYTMKIASEVHGLDTIVLPIIKNKTLNENCLNEMIQINLNSIKKERADIQFIEREDETNLMTRVAFAIDCIRYKRRYIKCTGNSSIYTKGMKKGQNIAYQTTIKECFRKQFFRARKRQ